MFARSTAALALLLAPALASANVAIVSRQSTGVNQNFFFAGKSGGPPLASGANGVPAWSDPDPGANTSQGYEFRIVNLDKCSNGCESQNLEANVDPPDGVQFVVSTDKTSLGNATSTVTAIVVHVFTASGQTTSTLAPIAAVNGLACTAGGSCDTMGISTPQGYFFAAIYAGNPVTLTLTMRDICIAATTNVTFNGTAAWTNPSNPSACDTTGVIATSGANPLQFFVKFSFVAIPGGGVPPSGLTSITSIASLDDGPQSVFNFQNDSPSLANCPGFDDASNIYFPGDGSINLQTSGPFPFTPGSTGDAPGDSVIVIGVKGSTVPSVFTDDSNTNPGQAFVTAALSGKYPLLQRVPVGQGAQNVKGFTNSSDPNDANSYSLAFAVRDQAGLVALPPGTDAAPECALTGVRTTNIQGFLNHGSCFIATAAFRDYQHGPVAMLRLFRDRVLLKAVPGRAFVKWYYDWSPEAAEWLMKHPAFRYPVLLALLPVEALAWLGLHPPVLALLSLAAVSLLFMVIYLRLTHRREMGSE